MLLKMKGGLFLKKKGRIHIAQVSLDTPLMKFSAYLSFLKVYPYYKDML